MLPFLKQKRQNSGLIVQERMPDDQDEKPNDLEDIAKKILSAIKLDNHSELADLLKQAFQHLELEPHTEIEHDAPAPHSYEASKE